MNSIGIIGMGVMGQNLALNIADNNYKVAIYNRSALKTDDFLLSKPHNKIKAYYDIEKFVESLEKPRKILLMIKAGKPVDNQIGEIIPLANEGDIIMDGGNSNYNDTQRRFNELKSINIEFIGVGISGGEDGARYGPSIMPGGSVTAWEQVKDIFFAIAAMADDGSPCCTWLGPDGAGHFVKTIHNGIEYSDMQLIAEVYHVLRSIRNMSVLRIAEIFEQWNQGKLNSFLIEITSQILRKQDKRTENMLIEKVLDAAKQKGTGRWTVDSALDFGVPVQLISQAVFQRTLSSKITFRTKAAEAFAESTITNSNIEVDISTLENALYVARIISYVQGFQLLRSGSKINSWNLSLGNIASIWRNGCIIRSRFLDDIANAYLANNKLNNFMFSKYFTNEIRSSVADLRFVVTIAISNAIPVPGLSAAINYFDSITSIKLPTNLIQAQRDYFGAHGYLRTDTGSEIHHSNWKLN